MHKLSFKNIKTKLKKKHPNGYTYPLVLYIQC